MVNNDCKVIRNWKLVVGRRRRGGVLLSRENLPVGNMAIVKHNYLLNCRPGHFCLIRNSLLAALFSRESLSQTGVL
jgi:hypothetical protein